MEVNLICFSYVREVHNLAAYQICCIESIILIIFCFFKPIFTKSILCTGLWWQVLQERVLQRQDLRCQRDLWQRCLPGPLQVVALLLYLLIICTICPSSLGPFYKVSYYTKWVKNSSTIFSSFYLLKPTNYENIYTQNQRRLLLCLTFLEKRERFRFLD